MAFPLQLAFSLSIALAASAAAPPDDAFLIACAEQQPECASYWAEQTPAAFSVRFTTSFGAIFDVDVMTSWAPPMAARFFLLSRLQYFVGSPLYRVLSLSPSERFVAQWGYRGSPLVDAAWIQLRTSNETVPVAAPGNVRGSVAFGTEVAGPHQNCTASMCSLGFSVELFVNLADNPRLDAADFSPFGSISAPGMAILDRVYAAYGELVDLCAGAATPGPYCVPDGKGGFAGVNLTSMLAEGRAYLERTHPLLDYISRVDVLHAHAAMPEPLSA